MLWFVINLLKIAAVCVGRLAMPGRGGEGLLWEVVDRQVADPSP
jgi:hypothetical protein